MEKCFSSIFLAASRILRTKNTEYTTARAEYTIHGHKYRVLSTTYIVDTGEWRSHMMEKDRLTGNCLVST